MVDGDLALEFGHLTAQTAHVGLHGLDGVFQLVALLLQFFSLALIGGQGLHLLAQGGDLGALADHGAVHVVHHVEHGGDGVLQAVIHGGQGDGVAQQTGTLVDEVAPVVTVFVVHV